MEPAYVWDAISSRYRHVASGQYVSATTVHGWLIETTVNAGRSVRELTQQLRTGDIPLKQWQLDLSMQIRMSHSASAAAAKGGLAQMTTADWARVEGHIARELAFLDNFARGIADGSIPLDGRVLARAEQYVLAGRQTYADFERREMVKRGASEERNERGKTDSCDGCLSETARGWVSPIGSLSLPGSRDCLARCGCQIVYR